MSGRTDAITEVAKTVAANLVAKRTWDDTYVLQGEQMRKSMAPGTVVELPDLRRGTVVYHGLDGYGIRWGIHSVQEKDLYGCGGWFNAEVPVNYEWFPDAMLRDPYAGASMPCVGWKFVILKSGYKMPMIPEHNDDALDVVFTPEEGGRYDDGID